MNHGKKNMLNLSSKTVQAKKENLAKDQKYQAEEIFPVVTPYLQAPSKNYQKIYKTYSKPKTNYCPDHKILKNLI